MVPLNGKGGQQALACWVKLPFLCLIAVALAFAIVVLIGPLMNNQDPSLLCNDPSNQQLLANPTPKQVAHPLSIEQVPAPPPEIVSAPPPKIEEQVAVPPAKIEPAASGNASQSLLQFSSEPEMDSCDWFQGKWVEEKFRVPLYENSSCPIITAHQNCAGNGRPDSGYLNWKWKPAGCELPDLDPVAFLELMRGKTLAFTGDSVARNHYEALMCALWQVEVPVDTSSGKVGKWLFTKYDFRAVRIWSSWLVNVTSGGNATVPVPENLPRLHLDEFDANIANNLASFDVLVVASGHWWGTKAAAYVVNGTTVVGGQGWWNSTVPIKHDTYGAFAEGMRTALQGIVTHPDYKGLTIFRTWAPDHYEGGNWNTGGSCTGKTKPLLHKEVPYNNNLDSMYKHQMTAIREALEVGKNSTSKLSVMDVTLPFTYRADAHPGPYRNKDPTKRVERDKNGRPPPQDCLHWCTPGAIDTWNEYLFAMLKRHYHKQ